MGYKIETYSLSELNKISTPGKVIPSLFWLIPIGHWDSYELEQLWNNFTRKKSRCQELGLMLVKNNNRWDSENNISIQTSDLSDLTGKLTDILPSGINSIYENNYFTPKENNNQVLILSGSYPQPGWGVLTSIKNNRDIEYLIDNTLNKINPNSYSIFIKASDSFKKWETSKISKPIKDNIDILLEKHKCCVELNNELENLILEIQTELKNSFHYEILKKFKNEEKFNEFSELLGLLFKEAD